MALSCSCYDFDPCDYDSWWETGCDAIPPPGQKCCECRAPLPEGKPVETFISFEAYDPEDEDLTIPPDPEDVLGDEPEDVNLYRFWEQRYDAMEEDRERTLDALGWDSDQGRYVRETHREYRCERCADLAESFEASKEDGGLGFCKIAPGELIEAHMEFGQMQDPPIEIRWRKGDDGVFNPVKRSEAI